MPSTTPFSFGDVVLVPFPFTNQSASKRRPAVIVSSNSYNENRPDVILAAITDALAQFERAVRARDAAVLAITSESASFTFDSELYPPGRRSRYGMAAWRSLGSTVAGCW